MFVYFNLGDSSSDFVFVYFNLGDSSSDFEINENNGRLVVAQGVQLDYTRVKIYTLVVIATNGFSIAETPVIIYIKTCEYI